MTARGDECCDGKVDEDHRQDQINCEMAMPRAGAPGATQAPRALNKEQREQCKEHAGDLMPQGVCDVRELFPESLAAAHGSAGEIARSGACVDWLFLLTIQATRSTRLRLAQGGLERGTLASLHGVARVLYAIAQHFRDNARSDAEPAA